MESMASLLNWRKPVLGLALRAHMPTAFRELRLLRRLDRAPDDIRCLHDQRLEALLRFAFEQTDYYREVLGDCGVVRDGVVHLSKFDEIPLLTKDIIRAQGYRMRAHRLPRRRTAYRNRTGGSTGQPMEYWQDNYYWSVNVATKLYHFEMLGRQIGEPELKIWGSERDLMLETGTWSARIQAYLYNRRIRACGQLDDTAIEAIIAEVNRFRPKSIWAYIDGLHTISQYINHGGHRVHCPAAILVGGGTLLPPMREAIIKAFGAPVINFYGSREMGDVACECTEMAGLHVSSNSHAVEVVDPNGRPVVGEEGDLVLTSLHNYAMPFIRYRIGDRGCLSADRCACGRGYPILERVSGRSIEAFVRNDGTTISPIFIITAVGLLIEPKRIKRIQYVQETYDLIRVRVVVDEEASTQAVRAQLETIETRIKSIMGSDCTVSFDHVDDIPAESSGKYLYTISKVAGRSPHAGAQEGRNQASVSA
jgi:phenylacetate-CoA ligase